MEKEEVLTVTFCSDSSNGEAGLAVFKGLKDGKTGLIKMETGEQAHNLYFLLTNQSAKVEDIKVDKSESGIKAIRMNLKNINVIESMWNLLKRAHQEAQVHGVDNREDLWEGKENE